ncbi:hypothetical protein NW767_000542 [Fusarium falciforme]|uniref:Uncharacterized protein n=1 Tax=Fusarium falciforme TaxID=195108 RepID=A0A9W8R8E2_9HYPO|nr:hypothetical protein NW755_005905 [Fusarium falciforme]KAJ4210273.1 hypothetical protein NW767_000542 [Fusarium falciforme]KAJ4253215.1 hypothetical protein NW757_005923 [Fusarium falciforme]
MPRATPHHPLAIRLIMDPIPWILPIINLLVAVLEFPLVTLVSSYRSTTKLSLLLRQGGADSSARLQQLQKYPIPSLLGHAPAPTLIDSGLDKADFSCPQLSPTCDSSLEPNTALLYKIARRP